MIPGWAQGVWGVIVSSLKFHCSNIVKLIEGNILRMEVLLAEAGNFSSSLDQECDDHIMFIFCCIAISCVDQPF